ncbi:hypothetical protein [Nonomuraea candida]|uniref:hypothetical protein n=1 Tax=Nonomuraea candida TaxID=359159 RepID=UPI0005BBECBE|nr:hypothetical protein [Nonomuraea candida]
MRPETRRGARPGLQALAVLAAGLLLAGCAPGNGGAAREGAGSGGPAAQAGGGVATQEPQAGGGTGEAVPHGYVEGAEEMPEQQSRLVLADGGPDGRAHVLDLLTGRTTAVADAPDVRDITDDGRYAYLTTGAGTLRVIDGGGWTVDHGDHVHYYRTAARELGTVTGRPPYEVHGDPAVTAVRSGDGTATLFDRARMDQGELVETGRLTGVAAVVPYRERLLVAQDGAVQVRDRTGGTVAEAGTCADAEGTAVTRRGVVFGCADGALLVTEKDGAFEGVRIRYPRGTEAGERAKAFRHRPGSSTLAARAGKAGTWALDVTARTWRLLKTGPVVAVCATGEDTPVLSLTADGVLQAHDPRSGERTATGKLLTTQPAGSAPRSPTPGGDAAGGSHGEAVAGAPVIQADTSRAYVNDPAGRTVHEIDYNDDLRRARAFEPGFAPAHMTETGR